MLHTVGDAFQAVDVMKAPDLYCRNVCLNLHLEQICSIGNKSDTYCCDHLLYEAVYYLALDYIHVNIFG